MDKLVLPDDVFSDVGDLNRRISDLEGNTVNIAVLGSDPTVLEFGNIWYRSDLNKLCIVVDTSGTIKRSSAFS